MLWPYISLHCVKLKAFNDFEKKDEHIGSDWLTEEFNFRIFFIGGLPQDFKDKFLIGFVFSKYGPLPVIFIPENDTNVIALYYIF